MTAQSDPIFIQAVFSLGYTEDTWDNPYPDQRPNSLSFEQIRSSSQFADTALVGMGVATAASWNCWVNHYFFANWNDLTQMPGPEDGQVFSDTIGIQTDFGMALQQAYITLGWSQDRWVNDPSVWPSSESKDWDELSDAEQAAAKQACWNQNTWDRITIPQW
jgi:hypothetical protein